MFLIFAPLMLLGGLALLSSRSRHQAADAAQAAARQLPGLTAGSYYSGHGHDPHRGTSYYGPHGDLYHTAAHYGAPHYGAPAAPSPLVVFNQIISTGQVPPPQVILCAIAEAETLGQMGLAHQIFQTYVLPVVQAAEYSNVANARYAGPPAHAPTPAYGAPAPAYGAPAYSPAAATPAPYDYSADPTYAQAAQAYQGAGPQGPQSAPAAGPGQAADHGDDGGGLAGQATAHAAQALRSRGQQAQDPQQWSVPGGMSAADENAYALSRIHDMARGQGRAVEVPQTDGGPGDDAESTSSGTLTVSGKSSPIDGVGTEDWGAFVGRVSRELPTYTTARHVGQFRQRRDRLTELGIDPGSVIGSPDAQAAALEADMNDAYHHAASSGMLDEHLGSVVSVPVSGVARPMEVTLSGVLGVIQAAGLEGAASWLHDERDRHRFSGTTQAFVRTNGAF